MMSENQRIIQLKELLVDQPKDAFMNFALALEYIKIGDMPSAEKQFHFLMTEHPDYVGTYYHFAKFLEQSQRYPEAKEVYEKGIKVASDQKDLHSLSELKTAFMNMNISLDEL